MNSEDFDLAFAIGLPPRDAVAYLKSKGLVISNHWLEIEQAARARAFTIVGVTKLDVLEDVRSALVTALEQGRDKKWFVAHLQPLLEKKGWWGKGGATPARLRLIWQQNIQDAYMVGRYRSMLANSEDRPYWQYSAKMDARTRPHHKALHNKVFRFDDVFWKTHYPPNGFRCRCMITALTRSEVANAKLAVSSGEGHMVTDVQEVTSRKTGEVFSQTRTGYQPEPGGAIRWTDNGFDYNSGSLAFGTDTQLARKLCLVQDKALYEEVVQALNNAPLRHKAFAAQVEAMLQARHTGVSVATVGFTERAVADFVEKRGHEPSRVMLMSDKQLMHADSDKHKRDGIALTVEELTRLPILLTQAEKVLWDNENSNVSYVIPDADPALCILIVVDTPAQGKRKKMTNGFDSFVNAYKVSRTQIKNPERYEVIR